MIISAKNFKTISLQKEGSKMPVSINFGMGEALVEIKKGFAVFDSKFKVDLKTRLKDKFCYLIDEEGISPIAFFSDETQKFYKLIPTIDWPSFSISSTPMHQINCGTPKQDSLNKIRILKPKGVVLDTCMGLGYTAILAAKVSKFVHTFEIDENVHYLASINPLSNELFSLPNIEIKQENIVEAIKKFKGNFFDCIIHDPPTFKLAPDLYSSKFYQELKRVLKPGGKIFHYTPFWGVKRGIDFPAKIRIKMKQAGFRIEGFFNKEAGLLCRK